MSLVTRQNGLIFLVYVSRFDVDWSSFTLAANLYIGEYTVFFIKFLNLF